jgi:hypothetical protein
MSPDPGPRSRMLSLLTNTVPSPRRALSAQTDKRCRLLAYKTKTTFRRLGGPVFLVRHSAQLQVDC